jgi:hypothetical protein
MLAALGAALILAGCASIARGTSENVQFESEPTGAQVTTLIDPRCPGGKCSGARENDMVRPEDGEPRIGPSCMTPCALTIARRAALTATFTKPGYAPQSLRVVPRSSAKNTANSVVGNVVMGGVTGMAVDFVTGAALDHYPNPLRVVLTPVKVPASAPATKRKHGVK